MKRIILASQSPRRRELLKQIGLEFEVIVSDTEEKISNSIPKEVVLELSSQKAEAVWKTFYYTDYNDAVIIGADTVVSLGDSIMGKPKDREDAKRILKKLSGNTHSVWTGVTIIWKDDQKVCRKSFTKETKVTMYPIEDGELDAYLKSGEADDKAGAYAIQGLGARFIEDIQGDYNNVVGLPVAEVYQQIKKIIWQ